MTKSKRGCEHDKRAYSESKFSRAFKEMSEVGIAQKAHEKFVDGDIPIVAFYSGAHVHDSSVALPLMQEASQRVMYLYDLQDGAYDADIIRNFSTEWEIDRKSLTMRRYSGSNNLESFF